MNAQEIIKLLQEIIDDYEDRGVTQASINKAKRTIKRLEEEQS